MGIMVYSLLWVMQDFVHQPYGLRDRSQGTKLQNKLLSSLAQKTQAAIVLPGYVFSIYTVYIYIYMSRERERERERKRQGELCKQ